MCQCLVSPMNRERNLPLGQALILSIMIYTTYLLTFLAWKLKPGVRESLKSIFFPPLFFFNFYPTFHLTTFPKENRFFQCLFYWLSLFCFVVDVPCRKPFKSIKIFFSCPTNNALKIDWKLYFFFYIVMECSLSPSEGMFWKMLPLTRKLKSGFKKCDFVQKILCGVLSVQLLFLDTWR